jgi:hypothetical protein
MGPVQYYVALLGVLEREAVSIVAHSLLLDAVKGAEGDEEAVYTNLDQACGIWNDIAGKYPTIVGSREFMVYVKERMPGIYRSWIRRRVAHAHAATR